MSAEERARGPHRGGGGGEPGGVQVARLYALEWGPAATVRGAVFCIRFGDGIGLICTGYMWFKLGQFCEQNIRF
jgi:hypothetical protein